MNESGLLTAKKRLFFVHGEDFNFLTYNILLLLNELECTSSIKPFVDHRKLSFLIDFSSNGQLVEVLQNQKGATRDLNIKDKQSLIQAYSNGATRLNLVTRVIQALAKKEIVSTFHPERNSHSLNLSIETKRISNFIFADVFKSEKLAIKRMASYLRQARIMSLKTMLDKIFETNGISVWHA